MSIHHVFPRRALRYTPPCAQGSKIGNVLLTLLVGGVFFLFFFVIGAPLIVDTLIGDQYEVLPYASSAPSFDRYGFGGVRDNALGRVSAGCRPLLLLQWCPVEMTHGDVERDILVILLGFPIDFQLGRTETGWLVAHEAQVYLGNRWLVAGPAFGFCGVIFGREIYKLWYENAPLEKTRGPLELIEVEISKAAPNGQGFIHWTYRPVLEGRRTTFVAPDAFEPLIIDDTPGERPIALAVRRDPRAHAFLLDRDLATLDLAPAERDALLDAIDAAGGAERPPP